MKYRIYYECKLCGTYQFVRPLKPCRSGGHGGCHSKAFYKRIDKPSNSVFNRDNY